MLHGTSAERERERERYLAKTTRHVPEVEISTAIQVNLIYWARWRTKNLSIT